MKANNNTRKEEIYRKIETSEEIFYISENKVFMMVKDGSAEGIKSTMKLKLEEGTIEEAYNLVQTNEFFLQSIGIQL